MDDASRAEAHAWMERAEIDLRASRKLIEGMDPVPPAVTYHCQQAAEKALKAVLAAYDRQIPRTHDLRALLAQCGTVEPSLSACEEAAEALTPYATEYRYPTGAPDPSLGDAAEAIRLADDVVGAVRRLLFDGR